MSANLPTPLTVSDSAAPRRLYACAGRLARAREVLARGLLEGTFSAAAAVITVGDSPPTRWFLGHVDEGESPEVGPDTLFDLASLTKPLATAASLLVLVESGELHLAEEARRFLAGPPRPHLAGITLRHLATHTSGLPAWRKLYGDDRPPSDILETILTTDLEATPGSRYCYSDLGYVILGHVIELVSGLSLDVFSRDHVFSPAGLRSTGFRPLAPGSGLASADPVAGPEAERRAAATAHCPLRQRTLRAEVHDGNAYALGGVAGHAGLFGTADDVSRFVRLLVGGGQANGGTLFSPAGARLAVQRAIPADVGGHSIGWFVPPNGMHVGGDLWANEGFSHSGFTGTSAFGDPVTGITVVLLTNAVLYSTGRHLRLRRLFHNAVAAAMLDAPDAGG